MFYGEDPERWVEWIDVLVAAHNFTVFKTRKFMYGFNEGHALSWYGDEISQYGFSSWGDLKVRLLNRFNTSAKEEKEQLEQSRFMDILKEISNRFEQRWKRKEDKEVSGGEDIGKEKRIKKSQEEKTLESDDVKQVESDDGGDDLIMYSNQLIQYVKSDMLILAYPVMVQEKDDPETETLLFDEDNSSKTEMDSGACQVFEKILKRRKKVTKKKKRLKKLFSDIEDQLVEFLSHKESDNSDMLGIQMENTTKRQRKSWLEWSKGNCHWVHTRQRLDRKWMLIFRKKKRKRKREIKVLLGVENKIEIVKSYQRGEIEELEKLLVKMNDTMESFTKEEKAIELKLYNTMTQQKEVLNPINLELMINPGKVRMYVCGMTAYDLRHIGHNRAAVFFDVLYRYLKQLGYEVNYVRIFTDVDDKIIKHANENGEKPLDLSKRFCKEYWYLRSHIDDIIIYIDNIIEKGLGYAVKREDVFLSVEKFTDYGKLSCQLLEHKWGGEQIEVDPRKRKPAVFTLWKAAKPNWESSWGQRVKPRWHIESSVVSAHYLSPSFVVHGGGADLKFPHHENKLAQTCSVCDDGGMSYWLHNRHVTIHNDKMAKSKKNLYEFIEKEKAMVVSVEKQMEMFYVQCLDKEKSIGKLSREKIELEEHLLQEEKRRVELIRKIDELVRVETSEKLQCKVGEIRMLEHVELERENLNDALDEEKRHGEDLKADVSKSEKMIETTLEEFEKIRIERESLSTVKAILEKKLQDLTNPINALKKEVKSAVMEAKHSLVTLKGTASDVSQSDSEQQKQENGTKSYALDLVSIEKAYETEEDIIEEMKKEAKSMKLSTEEYHKKKKKVEKVPCIVSDWPLEEHELKALEARRARALREIEHKRRKLGLVEDDNSKTEEGYEHEKKEDNVTRVVNGRDDSEKAFYKELFYHSRFHGTLADIFLRDTDLISDSRGMVAFVATITTTLTGYLYYITASPKDPTYIMAPVLMLRYARDELKMMAPYIEKDWEVNKCKVKEQKLESRMCSSLRGRMLKVSLKKACGTSYPKSIWNVKEIGNILV
ncbi:hypothetical protein BRARA_K01109 [Brassica rapa]|uniref:tRNA synthetases class I catalytic domain-containing protein n=1 Tax=Brassica campestris TaxID=3711 RepID=A0A397L1T3_BRACM|nr:hypothetical protein BRARA_K01109 [Brassica rapa]